VIREDLKVAGLTEDVAQDRRLWRDRIKILDLKEVASQLSFVCVMIGWLLFFGYCVCIQVVLLSGKKHYLTTSVG